MAFNTAPRGVSTRDYFKAICFRCKEVPNQLRTVAIQKQLLGISSRTIDRRLDVPDRLESKT